MPNTKAEEQKRKAVERVARETLRNLELAMQHPETQHEYTAPELRRALEAAYDEGRKSALS